MFLKRKRSDSEISTTSSLVSSSPLSSRHYTSLDNLQSPNNSIQTPSLFSSRTRKRHRDNRPEENVVHQHTLSLLFSAQQNSHTQAQAQAQAQSQSPSPSRPRSQEPVAALPPSSIHPGNSHQASLHSFWTLPTTRGPSPLFNLPASLNFSPTKTPIPSLYLQSKNCEDCDASLGSGDNNGDAMDPDAMMDTDLSGENYGCSRCGKQVCHSCAVSNLGVDRRCLLCAGKGKQWVGGSGWY